MSNHGHAIEHVTLLSREQTCQTTATPLSMSLCFQESRHATTQAGFSATRSYEAVRPGGSEAAAIFMYVGGGGGEVGWVVIEYVLTWQQKDRKHISPGPTQ
jgi:hypothetical protein